VTCEHLAGVDAHAQLKRDAVLREPVACSPRHRALHAQAGAHRSLGIITVRDGRAEDRHHVVCR